MFGVLSVIILAGGATVAYESRLFPARRKMFEGCGGILFITGLVLLGFTFPIPY